MLNKTVLQQGFVNFIQRLTNETCQTWNTQHEVKTNTRTKIEDFVLVRAMWNLHTLNLHYLCRMAGFQLILTHSSGIYHITGRSLLCAVLTACTEPLSYQGGYLNFST